MAKRPALTEDSFLKHIFSPKKNAQPTGLRKRTLSGLKGRKKARLTAWNKMPATNQAILDRTGNREAYLRGEVSIADAKRQLRLKAVDKGFVKPLKGATQTTGVRTNGWQVFHHLNNLNQRDKDPRQIAKRVNYMTESQRRKALTFKSEENIAAAASPQYADEDDWVEIDGHTQNVFWYK